MVILFSTKCFLFVYMYIDLLKLKTYKPSADPHIFLGGGGGGGGGAPKTHSSYYMIL